MKVFDAGKARMIGLPCGEKTDDMLSRFHLIPERNEQTDRRTDRFAILITRVNVLMCDKNHDLRQISELMHTTKRKLLVVPTLFFVVPSHVEGHHSKVEGNIKNFCACSLYFVPLHF